MTVDLSSSTAQAASTSATSAAGPHACQPLAAGTIRQIHFILSGALKRAVRWRWIATSPIVEAEPPAAPKPNPQPPSAAEAAQILGAAWERDPEWGLLIWLVMVTRQRRGELCSIRWRDVDLDRGVLTLARSIGQRDGAALVHGSDYERIATPGR